MRRSPDVVQGPTEVSELATRLGTLIQSGDVVVGDRLLPERDLTEQLGVSRRKLRQAMAVLEHKALFELCPGVARLSQYVKKR